MLPLLHGLGAVAAVGTWTRGRSGTIPALRAAWQGARGHTRATGRAPV